MEYLRRQHAGPLDLILKGAVIIGLVVAFVTLTGDQVRGIVAVGSFGVLIVLIGMNALLRRNQTTPFWQMNLFFSHPLDHTWRPLPSLEAKSRALALGIDREANGYACKYCDVVRLDARTASGTTFTILTGTPVWATGLFVGLFL